MLKRLFHKYREILLYLIFGGATTLCNWTVYTLCIKAGGMDITASNAVAWFCAVLFAYVTNKLFVFQSHAKSTGGIFREALSFFGSRALSGVIEIFLPGILVSAGLNQKLFSVDGALAKVIVSILIIILNYVLSKFFVFRKTKEKNTKNP